MELYRRESEISPSHPYFRIWSCGTFRVEALTNATPTYEPVKTAQWGGSSYPRLLLKGLLCCPGRRARREALLEMLWPGVDVEQATQYLNTGATKLRSLLRPAKGRASLLLTEENASYSLEGQCLLWIDIDAITTLLRNAERIGRTSPEALSLLEEAAQYLNRGNFLEGEEGVWLLKQRRSIKELRYRCQLWIAEAYAEQGMAGQAETVLSALLADDPTDEDVLRRLLSLLHKMSLIHKARRLYEETKHLLKTSDQQLSQVTITFVENLLKEPPRDEV